jgi:wyosine [tRNA(Phe)-imidazoG37] synthetase (radical SAM superfamily)
MKGKKRILIDLDAVTIAFYPAKDHRKEDCINFIKRVKNNEFKIVTPANFDVIIKEWDFKELVKKISEFYHSYSSRFVNELEIISKLRIKGYEFETIQKLFENINIKREDILVILVCSLEKLDYIISYNRKHLKNMEGRINELLKELNLNEINIRLPNEI